MYYAIWFAIIYCTFHFAIFMISTGGKSSEELATEEIRQLKELHKKEEPTQKDRLEKAESLRRMAHPMICEILRHTPEEIKMSYWTNDKMQKIWNKREIYQLGLLFDFLPTELLPEEFMQYTPIWKEYYLTIYGMHPIDGDIYTERPIEPRDEINERCRSIVKKYGYWDYDKERPNIFRSDELYRFLKFPNDYEEEEAAELRRELVKRNEMESLATKEFEKSLEEARKS